MEQLSVTCATQPQHADSLASSTGVEPQTEDEPTPPECTQRHTTHHDRYEHRRHLPEREPVLDAAPASMTT